MTFDQWWLEKWVHMGSVLGHAERDIAQQAWNAATEVEREECAKVCEAQTQGFAVPDVWDSAALECASAIRAR